MSAARVQSETPSMAPTPSSAPAPAADAPRGAALLTYIEEMLLELAHMASAGGEPGLAASLAIAAIQCGTRIKVAGAADG